MNKLRYCFILLLFACIVRAQVPCAYWSTFLGKNNSEDIKSLTQDNAGNYYIIMQTNSQQLPVTPGLIHDTLKGFYDAYLAKFDSCGVFIWGTYLGTPFYDSGERICICKDGNIAFCGYAQGGGLPTTAGAFQTLHNGQSDAFVGKINPNGQLLWLTYFGAGGSDLAYEIACDPFNNIVIGGTSTSTTLHTTATSFQQTMAGNNDAFLARFKGNGQFKWCTFYGGSGSEDIHAVTTDKFGNIIGSGGTFSFNLSTSPGAHQPIKDVSMDCYLIKLDSLGNRLFSTFFGGNSQDDAYGLATDNNANIYMSGLTGSTNFTTTPGAYQATLAGSADTYLAKFSPAGVLGYCTLLGGSDYDFINKMTYYNNHLYLIGNTASTNFPMIGGSVYNTLQGATNVLLIKYNLSGMPITTSYFGGSAFDTGNDIVANANRICFVGKSTSLNYPVSGGAFQMTSNGNDEGVITRMIFPPQVIITKGKEYEQEEADGKPFPNPFQETLKVYNKKSEAINIYDVLGKPISVNFRIEQIGEYTQINFDAIPAGIYVLRVGNRWFKIICS
jgi:hypothetical protein